MDHEMRVVLLCEYLCLGDTFRAYQFALQSLESMEPRRLLSSILIICSTEEQGRYSTKPTDQELRAHPARLHYVTELYNHPERFAALTCQEILPSQVARQQSPTIIVSRHKLAVALRKTSCMKYKPCLNDRSTW